MKTKSERRDQKADKARSKVQRKSNIKSLNLLIDRITGRNKRDKKKEAKIFNGFKNNKEVVE